MLPATTHAQLLVYGSSTTTLYAENPATGLVNVSVRAGLVGGTKAALAQRASDGLLVFIAGTVGNDSVFTLSLIHISEPTRPY